MFVKENVVTTIAADVVEMAYDAADNGTLRIDNQKVTNNVFKTRYILK